MSGDLRGGSLLLIPITIEESWLQIGIGLLKMQYRKYSRFDLLSITYFCFFMASLCCFRMMHYYCFSFKRAVNITTITLCTFLELLRYCDAVNSVQGFYWFQDIFWTQIKIFFSNFHERNCCCLFFHEDFSSIPRTTYLSNSNNFYIISRHIIWYLHSCPKQLILNWQ